MKKQSFFKQHGLKHIDYKDTVILEQFIDMHGRIVPRWKTGLSAGEQSRVARAVKRARYMALLPYVRS